MIAGVLAVLAVLFYAEENWRGRSAWDTAKQTVAAKQEKLDWAAYIPPEVPDDQNCFKAPKMRDWFTGQGTNELTGRLSLDSFAELARHRADSNASVTVAEIFLRPPDTNATAPAVVPLILLDNTPLSEAVRRLSDQANLKVDLDPQVDAGPAGPDGKPAQPLRVNGQWTNVSAFSVLMTLLHENNLRWVDDPKTGRSIIKNADDAAAAEGSNAAGRDIVVAMVRGAIGPIGEIADGFPISGNDLLHNPPKRLSVAPDSVPTRNELARLFPGTQRLRIKPAGNSLRVTFNLVPVPAADYLAWSARFSPELDTLREAVKRPFARMDGDYRQPYRIPSPNLDAVRVVASRLASRAGANLMLGRPTDALRELTLLHDFRGCLEVKPTGKPMALATAETDIAIGAMYAGTVSYGLRLQIWRDSELAVLQAQLSQADLISPLWDAIESERAGGCHLLEAGSRSAAAQVLRSDGRQLSFWQKARSLSRVGLKIMPRGWILKNMANLALLDQTMIDSIDRLQGVIHPGQVEAAAGRIAGEFSLHAGSPCWRLARNMISPMAAPLETTAKVQASVNEALVACALERFRLARGQYPAALRDLVPEFLSLPPADPVSGESLKYRPDGRGRYLLYSVGWDEKDDNGAPPDASGNGDWVWDNH
jgi:hypothetical protein